MNCRGCGLEKLSLLVDLGHSPISNELISLNNLNLPEVNYPLKVYVCDSCGFAQTPEITARETLFSEDYVYYSSFSKTWLTQCRSYAQNISNQLGLNSSDLVVEIASNDGYLLQYFKELGIQVLGVEPSGRVAQVAQEKGIPTNVNFFGHELAIQLKNAGVRPKLMVANNVLAHVPDIHDFVKGFEILLADDGVITFEFPHLSKLLENNEFDTIYHEHYSYLSLEALNVVFTNHNLEVYDVEFLSSHGGSLRIYVSRTGSKRRNDEVLNIVQKLEADWSPRSNVIIENFQERCFLVKINLLSELIDLKRSGKKVVGYGAAAKGNTLLNYCGISSDLLEYVVDLNPAKQSKFLPGSHIPIFNPSELLTNMPDVILILPWNLSEEITVQLREQLPGSVQLLIAIPELKYL